MDPKTLADVYGIHFTVQAVDEGGLPTLPNGQQGVPRDQAIRVAMENGPGVDRAQMSNVEISAQYGLFTQVRPIRPDLQNRPAWVITFSGPGVNLYPYGGRPYPRGPRPLRLEDVKHEVSVVIDAATGQYLTGFA
jgi:hypothetical protein